MEHDVCAICDDGGSVTCCDGRCQRAFHLVDSEAHDDCREKLGLTLEQAKIINEEEGFICKNCQFKKHQCFSCGLLGSSDDTLSQPEVFQCEHGDCGRFYHPKCIAKLLYPNSEEAILFAAEVAVAREKFTCLMHECMECKGVEDKNDRSLQFAVCRRCPTVYHRKCLPSEILFKSRKGPNDSPQRAWDDILPDRILMYCTYVNSLNLVAHLFIPLVLLSLFSLPELLSSAKLFCRKHKIVRKLLTPERNHIIFPEEANEHHVAETLEGAPMEQDAAEETEAPHQPASSEQIQLPPPAASDQNQCPAASDQNQCPCSHFTLSFAPSSLYKEPYPGNCGWLDDDEFDD
nr:unnamed protein product [Digitaria exilis]